MRHARIAILPVASYEQHGPFLPFDTDIVIAKYFAEKIQAIFDESMMLPAVPYGIAEEHQCNSISIRLENAINYWMDILSSIRESMTSIKLIVMVNGHGGNKDALKAACNSFNYRGNGTKAMVLDVFQPKARKKSEEIFGAGPVHGDSAETSVYEVITGAEEDIEIFVKRVEPHALSLFQSKHLSQSGIVSKTDRVFADKNAGRMIIEASIQEMKTKIEEYMDTILSYELNIDAN